MLSLLTILLIASLLFDVIKVDSLLNRHECTILTIDTVFPVPGGPCINTTFRLIALYTALNWLTLMFELSIRRGLTLVLFVSFSISPKNELKGLFNLLALYLDSICSNSDLNEVL